MARTDPASRISVVLSRPGHPGNVGAAARALKTMGFSDLRLVAPRKPPGAEAAALASGALDVLEAARTFDRLEEALADVELAVGFSARSRDLSHPVVALREAAPRLLAAAAAGRVALVFGNETFGLTNEELGRCQMLCNIPANPRYSSLNLAAAVQVACYEVSTAAALHAPAAGAVKHPAAIEDIEALYAHWESSMAASGFLDPRRPKRLMERMRRLFGRARLEREEVKLLRGMLAAYDKPKKRRAGGS
ncbi:MAG TPA: RNA methyltransferase [Usitatibacter sp.]|nr:RNA methyltransferase [Usitatibacter sp.]